MPYREPETWDFTLESIGLPEARIVCLKPEEVSDRRRSRMIKGMAVLSRATRRNDLSDVQGWEIDALDTFLLDAIVDWTLEYPPRNSRGLAGVIPLRNPDEPDYSPFEEVPGYVYQAIAQRIMQEMTEPPKSLKR